MDLLDASADFDPSDFDPLASPFRTAPRPVYESPAVAEHPQHQQSTAPDSPFTAAFGGSSSKLESPAEESSDLLIDLSAPTSRAPKTKPLLLAPQARLAPPSYAPLRNPSPLKQVFDAGSGDEEEEEQAESPRAFEMESPPGTARKVGGGEREEEEDGTPVKRGGGRRWSVMEQGRKERSRSRSPSKEMSPARFDADSSGFLLPIPSDSDCSLLMNEGGSFLLNGSHDAETTLNSFASGAGFGDLSGIGEEDEDDELDQRNMANLLNGLSDSCIGGKPPTTMTDTVSPILPTSLTSSTRHALSKSQNGRPTAESLSASTSSSVTIMDNDEQDERSLLACSTASYRTHRDSPARPRMASIQAERFASGGAEGEKTPMKARLGFGGEVGNLSGESRRSSGGCSAAESSSGDVRDMLKGWSGNGDFSMTDLYSQQPPSPLNDTSVVATATFELGLVSPIIPDKISALPLPGSPGLSAPIAPTAVPLPRDHSLTDLMDLSSAPEPPKLVNAEVAQPLVAPAMIRNASANGLKRLQEKMDAIRARAAAPSAPPTSAPSSIDSSPIVARPPSLSRSSSLTSISATPRRQQQPPARSLPDATPVAASSSSTTSVTRPASTVRRPGHSRHASIPILDNDAGELDAVFNPHRNAQAQTSPRAEALIDFMDAVATPAPKLARSGGMSMPMPTAMATPMARAPAKPRTSLLPSARKVAAPTPSSTSSKENGAPTPVVTALPASARKEATRERLDRLKEERKRREEGGKSPVKALASAGGLKRPTGAPSSSRLPPSSFAAVGAAALPRPRPPLSSRTAPSTSSSSTSSTFSTRPSLADTLARKPSTITTSARVAFKPTVPRPSASSSSSSSALGARPKSLATAGSGSTGLRRPAATSTGLLVPGGSRIGKPAVGGGGGSRIGALGARANGAK